MPIGKRKGKVVKGAGQPGAAGSDNIGGSPIICVIVGKSMLHQNP